MFLLSSLDHSSPSSPHVFTKLGFQWLMDKKQLLSKSPHKMRTMRGSSQSLFTAGSRTVLMGAELLGGNLMKLFGPNYLVIGTAGDFFGQRGSCK